MIFHRKNMANQNLKTQIIILTVTDKTPELEFLWISGLCYAQKIFSFWSPLPLSASLPHFFQISYRALGIYEFLLSRKWNVPFSLTQTFFFEKKQTNC